MNTPRTKTTYTVPPPRFKFTDALVEYWLIRMQSLKAEYPPELLARQRAAFVAKMEKHNKEVDGSDTSMKSQLEDSGYGSQGIM